jgi:hypothetical protein
MIWALQDILRFKTERRRSGVRGPSIEKDVIWTKLTLEELRKARTFKVMQCHHNPDGEIVKVRSHDR